MSLSSAAIQKERSAFGGAILLTVVGIAVTMWATLWLISAETDRQLAQLGRQAEQAASLISDRFAQYETLINAGRALFAGSRDVSRTEWQRFAQGLLQQQDFVGLAGLGRVLRIPAGQLGVLQAQIRDEGLDAADVNLFDQQWICPILFNEPMPRNRPSIGLDICQVQSLSSALETSLQRDDIILSQRLDMVSPDDQRQPGYVMLAWTSESQIEDPLFRDGWISVSIMADALFALPLLEDQSLKLEIFDLEDPADVPAYQSEPKTAAGHETEDQRITHEQRFFAGGREWRLDISKPLRTGSSPWLALAFGLAATVLTAITLFLLLSHRSRAELLAEQMSQAFRESEDLLSSITNNIFEGIYRGDLESGLIYVNRALTEMFHYDSPEQMIAAAGPMLYAKPEQREELLRLLEHDGYYSDAEVEFVRADGSRFIGINNAVASLDDNGRIRYFDGAIYDITARKIAEREVFKLAHYDALTGLPNRTMLNDHLTTGISMAQRSGTGLAVLFVDLDHFKTINDSLGHDLGDQLLSQVAQRMREDLRESDLISRQGGDEFLIALSPANATEASHAAQRLLDLLEQPFIIDTHELNISSSVGIALYPDDGETGAELIRNADAAMYLAKDKGRSNFQFFTPDLNQRAHDRLVLEKDMREALMRDDFQLHYQPQLDLNSGKIIGVEALLRWTHPSRGAISPEVFIPVAEQGALIVSIGEWVIEQACRQLAAWRDTPLANTPISINVSAVQLWRGTLLETLNQARKRHDVPAALLAIELTESALMEDAEHAGTIIDEINQTGIRVTIDDFGTGYSSLAYLKRFRIAGLKVDRSFVSDIATDPDDAAIVAAILSMADDLKLNVIAEGVDDEAQIPILKAHGCRWAQGFLFSAALPPDALIDWMVERASEA